MRPLRFASGTGRVLTGFSIVRMRVRDCKGKFRCTAVPSSSLVTVSDERFEQMVADALDAIPPELGEAMENVAVVVEQWPTPQQAARAGGTLLGLYEGIPITRRGPISYGGVAPDHITVFRGTLCALALDEADLEQRVRVTVLHEVGHYFGMSDARLRELGWA
jgi:predicted Zn-dependent protease with MMP-like domain